MEDDIDSKILRNLLEKGPMSCRMVWKAARLNDRTVRTHLKLLQREGLIDQIRRGRSDCNSLTEKGERRLINDALRKIEKDLATLSHIDKKISPGQWKALKRQGAIINLLFRAKERIDSEKQQALESMFKVQCTSIREVGKIDIRVPKKV